MTSVTHADKSEVHSEERRNGVQSWKKVEEGTAGDNYKGQLKVAIKAFLTSHPPHISQDLSQDLHSLENLP